MSFFLPKYAEFIAAHQRSSYLSVRIKKAWETVVGPQSNWCSLRIEKGQFCKLMAPSRTLH